MEKALKESDYRELLLWILRLRKRFRVRGASMLPTLKEGDIIFYDPRAYRQQFPVMDDIVIVQHPARSELKIVKRVENVTSDGRVFIIGDNVAETTDSRDFGHVPVDEILGRVTSRLP